MCAERSNLIEIIDDTDKIFLRIDRSATNQLRILMNTKTRDNPQQNVEKKEQSKEMSDKLKRIINPSCKIYLRLFFS